MKNLQTNNHSGFVFEVAKNQLQQTRIFALDIDQPLAENEVLLCVDKFALTANNISYGITGNMLGYWQFFPTDNESEQHKWGRLPVMGFADVVASNCPEIQVGERVWGFMPMSTHLKIVAGNISTNSFADISPCRKGLSPLYSQFNRVKGNPFYLTVNEDYDILVRGLFTTAWLIEDFMFDNQYFGAMQYLITSASSKTSIALAFAIQTRAERPAIGITSNSNKPFVESLGCYDQVISYDDIPQLDPKQASILIDMAGGKQTLAAIHQHFTAKLRYSCRIGATQHTDISIDDNARDDDLPGVKPQFFFAPTQLSKRITDWGGHETLRKMNLSLLDYIDFCRLNIRISHTIDVNELEKVYQQTLAGKADASIGQIISLTAR
ncbi:DUF2855 family protein [Shewanella donghaensis]|uniref:DUF2855 family protein n=1 Tax=Shewanella donghaensis TaxID=238836 RepID=UPI001183202D|nr:DUF2855 family protein [Shewanella donghaensis]